MWRRKTAQRAFARLRFFGARPTERMEQYRLLCEVKVPMQYFIVCDGFDTQDLATQGSLGAVKKVSNPESNSLPKQPYPVRSAAGLVDLWIIITDQNVFGTVRKPQDYSVPVYYRYGNLDCFRNGIASPLSLYC